MKRFLTVAFVVALGMGVAGNADAAKSWDDMSWWGNTGATPLPVEDGLGNCDCTHPKRNPSSCGYWWWPKEPASNEGDMELWGNRGIVFGCWQQPEPTPPPPPPDDPPPPVERQVILLNNVLFDFDKAVLKPEGKAEVDKLIAEMKAHPGDTAVIEGHTCNIGTAEYNMGLGQRRADAVKRYMIENGIAPERVSTVSYGLTRPAVPNDSPANRKLNRRAEFQVNMAD